MEEDLGLLLRLEVAGARRHREPLRYAVWASLRRPASLQRPAELAMGGGVVRLEPDRLLILEDGALGRPGVEVGAR
jgi:hypothetical protein